MNNPVISYHTFIFPFLWNVNSGKKRISRDEFEKCKHPYWKREKFDELNRSSSEFLAQYRYFNPAARNAIYDSDEENGIVHNYRFDFNRPNESASFCIQKGEQSYTLTVSDIRLKLYNSGIGLIVYELENYDYSALKDINKINDYGRRLYMPFVNDYGECKLCADSITVKCGNQEFAHSVISGSDTSDGSQIVLPEFITKLLSNDEYSVTTQAPTKRSFRIEPVIGDRMFVACICQHNWLVNTVSQWNKETGRYAYLEDALTKSPTDRDNCARMLYEMIFIDGDGISCVNRTMLHKLLDDHVYARWLEYGTVTGITEYSMVCATSGLSYLSGAFLTEYVEMVELVLAQRASLLVFERMISDSALKKADIKRIQEQYILFQSQLLLQEVTPEQQGIELYEELLESLFIEKQSEQIEQQVEALFALKNYKNDSTESLILLVLAVLGISETVSTAADWFSGAPKEWSWAQLGVSLGTAIFAVALFLWNKRRK